MNKKLSKFVILLVIIGMIFTILPLVLTSKTVNAATKRTTVVESLLTAKGKLNKADWQQDGNESKVEILNNGNVFKVKNAAWPGYRICPYDQVPANEGYYVEFDVLETNPATTKLNLSGYVTNINDGAASNIYLSSLGIDVGAGTNYGANGDGQAVWNVVNSTLNAGYRYRFWFRINPESDTRGDLIIYKKDLAQANATYAEECVLLKLCTISPEEAHYAHIYFEGDITIDNFSVIQQSNETEIFSTDFTNTSVLDNTGVPTSGKMYYSGGSIVCDTYLTFKDAGENDRVVTYSKAVVDTSLTEVFELETAVKVLSTAGKTGIAIGLPQQDSAYSEGTFVYFENAETTTKLNAIVKGQTKTEVDLGEKLADDFSALKIVGKNDGLMEVYINNTLKATYEGVDFNGYVAIISDGSAGTSISFTPTFTVMTMKKEVGDGEDLANNFNTGYINTKYYEVDSHNAVSIPDVAEGIVAKDGKLVFNGTSDGTHFALKGRYADFILQFDWINSPWEDRLVGADGKVNFVDKPNSGLGVELYSPLGVTLGKTEPTAGWTEGKMIRFFDGLNLIQYQANGVAYNTAMGASFLTPDDCANIQSGKINLYEETVNIKMVVRNNIIKVYGVIMEDGEPNGDYSLLAEYPFDNCTGYIAFSTSEAGCFALDNIRVTKIDGWTDAQVDAYENFIEIQDELAPVQLQVPVLTKTDKNISWTAVENAVGYKVTVNGVEKEMITSTFYTLDATEVGSYTITVKAIGNGETNLDSVASEEVVITIEASNTQGEDNTQNTPDNKTEEKESSSCSSSLDSVSSISLLLLVIVAFVITKKRLNRNK